MRKVMTTVLGVVAAMMVFSLAACTPTADKNKTETTVAAVKETQAETAKKEESKPEETKTGDTKETKAKGKASIATEKMPDFGAPVLDVVSIYTVSEDGSKLEGTMDAIEGLNEQTLLDLLIKYGVLEEGTTVNSFSMDSEAASQEVGPGAAGPGGAEQSAAGGHAVLDLSKFPSENADMYMQAVANTFIENMDVTYVTIAVNGDVIYENMGIAE